MKKIKKITSLLAFFVICMNLLNSNNNNQTEEEIFSKKVLSENNSADTLYRKMGDKFTRIVYSLPKEEEPNIFTRIHNLVFGTSNTSGSIKKYIFLKKTEVLFSLDENLQKCSEEYLLGLYKGKDLIIPVKNIQNSFLFAKVQVEKYSFDTKKGLEKKRILERRSMFLVHFLMSFLFLFLFFLLDIFLNKKDRGKSILILASIFLMSIVLFIKFEHLFFTYLSDIKIWLNLVNLLILFILYFLFFFKIKGKSVTKLQPVSQTG